MYDRILVPTDGSPGARAAIEEAVALAELTGATVEGLYVVDIRDYNTLPEAKWLTLEGELEDRGEAALAAVREAAAEAGVAAETTVERGIPHSVILDHAAEADLVVMATHGRTGLGRVLLGSVTEKVVRRASVPVHVVRITGEDEG